MDGMFGSGGMMPPRRRMRGLPPTYGAPGYNLGGEEFEGSAGPPDGFPAGNFMPQGPVASPQMSAMYRLSQQMQQNNQNPPAPGSYTPSGSGPRAQSARSLAQRNMAGMDGIGQPPRNIPIANPNRGMQADGTYGGASQVSNPTYGNAGLGTVGVQQPSQYLAPGRRNPYYGNYVSGGRVQTGQMQNWVAGRWPGVPQGQQDEQFDPEAARARVADGSYKNRQIGMGYKAVPSMSKYIQDSKDQQAQKIANAKEFRQNRMAALAQHSQPDPNAAMQFAMANMVHPMMPGANQHNAAVMHMASQMHATNTQGQHNSQMFGLQQQQYAHQQQMAQQAHQLAMQKFGLTQQQISAQQQQAQRAHDLAMQQMQQQGRLGAAQLGLQFQQQNPTGNSNQFLSGMGINAPPAAAPGPPGNMPAQGMFPPHVQTFDPSQMQSVLDQAADMPDQAAHQHVTGLGVNSTHLDQFIAEHMNPRFFEGSVGSAMRVRRLQQARRLRNMYPNPPANPNAPLAPPGPKQYRDPTEGMFTTNPGF